MSSIDEMIWDIIHYGGNLYGELLSAAKFFKNMYVVKSLEIKYYLGI